jgi:3',5'-nucleoside bisphosphate phosphatase
MDMKVDLHLHTWISDGELAPTALVQLASKGGLDVVAVTDHDTAAGVDEARHAAADLPISVIPGIEISSRWEDQEWHILGYWIDPASEPIQMHQQRAGRRRSDRMHAMVDRLQRLGVDVSFSDVEAAAGPSTHTLGRPHLARALHAGGHTRFYGEAFVRFIGDGGPAFVAEGFPTPGDAIETIHAAGGVAVWAHPPIEWLDRALPMLTEWGLQGIECYRPGALPADIAALERSARTFGLFPTGGSDWHNPHRAQLGDFAIAAERVREVLTIGGVPLPAA